RAAAPAAGLLADPALAHRLTRGLRLAVLGARSPGPGGGVHPGDAGRLRAREPSGDDPRARPPRGGGARPPLRPPRGRPAGAGDPHRPGQGARAGRPRGAGRLAALPSRRDQRRGAGEPARGDRPAAAHAGPAAGLTGRSSGGVEASPRERRDAVVGPGGRRRAAPPAPGPWAAAPQDRTDFLPTRPMHEGPRPRTGPFVVSRPGGPTSSG